MKNQIDNSVLLEDITDLIYSLHQARHELCAVNGLTAFDIKRHPSFFHGGMSMHEQELEVFEANDGFKLDTTALLKSIDGCLKKIQKRYGIVNPTIFPVTSNKG